MSAASSVRSVGAMAAIGAVAVLGLSIGASAQSVAPSGSVAGRESHPTSAAPITTTA